MTFETFVSRFFNIAPHEKEYVRLEVGTAHRCRVDDTTHSNNHDLIIYAVR
jgi:hypothetical protein